MRTPTSGEPSAVEDAARGDDGHAARDRVHDLGHERHRGHRAGVPAGLRALRDDEVTARFDRRDGVTHLAAHVDDEHVVLVAALDHLARHAERRHEDRDVLVDQHVDAVQHLRGQGGQQVDAERS